MEQLKPFRHDLLPLAKPIQPMTTAHLVRPYTDEQLTEFRTRATTLEPYRLTKTGKLRKRIEPLVAEAWNALVQVSQTWSTYQQSYWRLNDLPKKLANRRDEINDMNTCKRLYPWLRQGMRCNLIDRQKTERPTRYRFHGYVITPGYGIPGESIRTGLSCEVLSYKDNQWKPTIIDCSWLATQTACDSIPMERTDHVEN